MDPTLPAAAPAPQPAPAVAGGGPAGPPTSPAPPPSASNTAPLFGGFRGGRPRKDGLKPGSPEALAADRENDRLRKERTRARARTENPPTLPPASGGAAPPPLPAVGADPGIEGGAPGIVVPWDQSTLKPLFDQLIPTLENLTVAQITSRAAKARLPKDVLAEVEKDARWAEPARKAVAISAPQVAAKWLNKSGISAENQAELVLGTAVASILTGHVMLMRKLDKLIASQATAPPPPPQEKN